MRKAFWLLFALALPALAQDPVLPAVTAIHTAPTLGELPPPVPFETMPPYRLTMPEQVGGFRLRDLGELQIYPGHDMQALPVPAQYYGAGAFQGLADRAHEADKTQLARTEK